MASQSVVKTEPLKAGHGAPKKLLGWLNSLLSDVKAMEPAEGKNITLRRLNPGTEISAKGGGGSGAGGTGTETYYVVINGTLYTQEFVVDGEPVVV